MHKYCGISYDKSHDDLETLRAALPWSTNQLSRFEDDTSSLRLTLNGFFNVYMKSFNMPYSNTTENSHEGFLWQKGVGLKKKWGKRYFVVKDGILSVYKHDNIPFESYQLMLSMVKPIDDPERPSCFSLFTANNTKPIVLQALTDYERDHWICIIQNNIQSALDKSGDSQTQEKNQSVDLPNTLPANQTCADCGAPNPTWACINWGTCICIHCGGVHRSLTTAISKVRSLTLDKLDDITLQLFSKIGNVTANSILEANVGQYKINSNSTKEERINFIKMKYVDRAFTAQSPVNLEEAIRTNNYLEVYKAICTRHFYRFPTSLHLAASIGDPMMCHLITLSLENPDIPDNGWTALSYAAYYGKIEAAQTLINDGCRPLPNDQMNHPYRIAMLKQDEEMAAVFLPYWDKSPVNGQLMGPPHKFA
ncbi:centaurin beta [Tritrichomonas foetus]|uniref:Centaurin beta n=1 Tax=Tritrichomonas foetus TaxID=1144522 RepID=A0A1J4K7U5_9EUKA|nr:centaurin beta [Tritrichomonas foetus]|eukprot:OHT06952.1 centaurin beta [Tritrichomonas foetus]